NGNQYIVEAWTSLPNNATDTINTNDATTILFIPALAGSYSIHSGLPSGGTNFQSFTELNNALNSYGVCAPVDVHVVPGTGPYNEQVIFEDVAGMSATNRVKIHGHNETITWNGGGLSIATMTFDNAHNFCIDSLNI